MAENRLLSGEEAAKLLGMSRVWLYQSEVPYVKLGRRRLYRSSDLRVFISRRVRK